MGKLTTFVIRVILIILLRGNPTSEHHWIGNHNAHLPAWLANLTVLLVIKTQDERNEHLEPQRFFRINHL